MATRTISTPASPERPAVAGVPISHPDRLIYPDLQITKLDVARYCEAVGDWMLPHVAGRPLTLLHCPAGLSSACIYMKHGKAWGPTQLRRVRIQEKTKVGEYLVADSMPAIVALIQMGIVEVHTWNSVAGDIDRPNRIVWDLDPGPEVKWPAVVDAARLLRRLVKTLGLDTWVKTTGGRGLHVVAPLTPAHDWRECLAFSKGVAQLMERAHPDRYTTAFPKLGRERKILVDYLRNNRTNTSIAAFSPRARPGAPVSMPLDWRELKSTPSRWTILTVGKRLSRLRRDPWAGYWRSKQQLTAESLDAMRRL